MRKIVVSLLLTLCLLFGSILTGCSVHTSLTANDMIARAKDALEKLESYEADFSLSYNVNDPDETDVGVYIRSDHVEMSHMNDMVRVEADINAGLYGTGLEVPYLAYGVQKGDHAGVYANTDGAVWQYTSENEIPIFDINRLFSLERNWNFTDSDLYSFDDTDVIPDDVYSLELSLTSAEFYSLFDSDIQKIFAESVFSDSVICNLYIDKTSAIPVRCVFYSSDKDHEAVSCDWYIVSTNMVDIDYVSPSEQIIESSAVNNMTGLTGLFIRNGYDFGNMTGWKSDILTSYNGTNGDHDDLGFCQSGYRVEFTPFDNFIHIATTSESLDVTNDASSYFIHAKMEDKFDGLDSVITEQQTANSYLVSKKDEGALKGISISDVKATNLNDRMVYWYSLQYTSLANADNFVYKEYRFYVDLGDENDCLISVAEFSDVRQTMTVSDVLAMNVLNHFNVMTLTSDGEAVSEGE